MLRVQLQQSADETIIRMEGRFVGKYARDTLEFMLRQDLPKNSVVDLAEVTYVDQVGESVLACLGCLGLQFFADSAYAIDVCERLRLPLAGKSEKKLRVM